MYVSLARSTSRLAQSWKKKETKSTGVSSNYGFWLVPLSCPTSKPVRQSPRFHAADDDVGVVDRLLEASTNRAATANAAIG